MDREAFVEEVLTPLVTGTTLVVRAPLDADDVATLIEARVNLSGIAELGEARRRVAAHVLYDAQPPSLDESAIRIGAAIHNLCWVLAQPHKDQARMAILRVATYSAHLATLPPPLDGASLVARHALVAGIRTLSRQDIRVRFWAGEQTFLGEEPPQRLLRWQRVRRVREERTTTRLFDEALTTAHGKAVVVALLGSSPLTDLLLDRPDPLLDLKRAARWLAVPHIARVVADAYLSRGLALVEGPLATALVALYGAGTVAGEAAREAAIATSFHSHLHLLDVLSRPPRDRDGHIQILRGYVQGRERTVADGFGLHAAATQLGLGQPHDLERDALLARNVAAYAEACAELVGARRLGELTALLARGVQSAGTRVMMSGPHV